MNQVSGMLDVAESIASLEREGARVLYASCDICGDGAEVKIGKVLDDVCTQYGLTEITGLVHASGVIRDKKIEQKSGEDFSLVFGTKVGGLLNVLKALEHLCGPDKHVIVLCERGTRRGQCMSPVWSGEGGLRFFVSELDGDVNYE